MARDLAPDRADGGNVRARFDRKGPLAIAPFAWGLDYEQSPASAVALASDGDVAVVMVMGPLTHHGVWWGGDTYDAIEERVAAALATSASTVVMKIDSPGGEVDGAFECARTLRLMAAAAGKRLVAYVDEIAASAAYALACAASAIYLPASARVGSIGVIEVVLDATAADAREGLRFDLVTSGARKADGNPHAPLTDEARARLQAEVDGFARLFFELVAGARGLSVDDVAAQQAAIYRGSDAVAMRLADAVASWDEALAMIAGVATDKPSSAAASEATTDEVLDMTRAELLAAIRAALAEDAPAEPAEPKKDEGEGGADMTAAELRAALRAFFAVDEAPPKHDEPDGDEGPAPAKPFDDDGDEEKPKAKACNDRGKAQVEVVVVDARAVLAQAEAAQNEARDALLDSRPDLAPDARAALATESLAFVRKALALIPRPVAPVAPAPAPAAPAAAVAAVGTRGATQGDANAVRPNADMDRMMGIAADAARKPYVEGVHRVFPTLTAEQARAAVKGGAA